MADLKEVKIHTGNLLASDVFKRKVILVPSAEVIQLKSVIEFCSNSPFFLFSICQHQPGS